MRLRLTSRRTTSLSAKKNKPPFLNDELYDTIDVEGSSWFISDRKEIEICLQKVEDADWPCVIPSHDEGHSSN